VDNLPPEAIPNPEQSDQPQKDLGKVLWDILEILVFSALLFLGINAITARIRVDGSSMEPTLHNNEFVIVNRLAYKLGKPARGDVIVLTFPPMIPTRNTSNASLVCLATGSRSLTGISI
jgi:signal peptidase I